MLRKNKLVTLVALLGIARLGFADQITLKNGDRLSGKVVKSDGKTLVLHTEFAGDVTVKFDAITQITTEEELHITTSDKKTVVGPVTTRDGRIEVATVTMTLRCCHTCGFLARFLYVAFHLPAWLKGFCVVAVLSHAKTS